MTSPFEWKKLGPSKITEELRKDYNRSQNGRVGGHISTSTSRTANPLEPRRFHVYSKAGVR